MGKITVIGSYSVALVIDVDRFPLKGETLIGRNFTTIHGGKGSNMAVAIRRLGAESNFIGKIGKDTYGESFLLLLEKEGVDASHVLFSEKLPTSVGMIISSENGANMIVIDLGPNAEFSAQDVVNHKEAILKSDVILSPLEIPIKTALAGARIAKQNGIRAILNPAPAKDLRNYDLSDIFALTPNETEGRTCLGLSPDDPIPDRELAVALLDLGVKHVMLTLGEKGIIWASHQNVQTFQALKVNAIDTVGAGDAFNAGLAVGLSKNNSISDAIQFGIQVASISVTKRGAIESYPFLNEIIE